MQNRFKKALTTPAKDRPVLDAALSSAEAVVDIVMRDDLLAAVPFVSTAFKAVKAVDSIRDRMFAVKLQSFVMEVEPLSSEERSELTRKLSADDEGRKAGETLLLVLEKLTDLDKPALLGMLLRQFGQGRITAVELRRLATAVDTAFADDLVAFLDEAEAEIKKNSNAPHREALVASGLTRVLSGNTIDSLGSIYYGVTHAGEVLHSLARRAD